MRARAGRRTRTAWRCTGRISLHSPHWNCFKADCLDPPPPYAVGSRNDVMNNTQRRFLRCTLIFLDNTLISAFWELAKREMRERINAVAFGLRLQSNRNDDMCRWINTDGQP